MKAILKKLVRDRASSRKSASLHDSAFREPSSQEGHRSLPAQRKPPKGTLQQFNDIQPIPDSAEERDSFGFDIVAIHGLGGDPEETWKHGDDTLWLRDLLPDALPGIRVFSYGYPSDIFFSSSTATIRDYALHLLSRLDSILVSEKDASRPIVYICHSLGGIVFKQAMILAPDRYPNVWVQSKGVLFFGTPHRGSFVAKPAKVLGDVLNIAWSFGSLSRTATKTKLLRDLEQNSRTLITIGDDFTRRASSLQIITYYETEITPGVGNLIVEESSAVIGVPHEKAVPMYRNHRDICKFSRQDFDDVHDVLENLKRMSNGFLTTGQGKGSTPSMQSIGSAFNSFEKECIRHLNTIDVAGHVSRLDRPIEGTFQWVPQNAEYNRWHSDVGSKLLCVTGYAGCGKTILSSFVLERLTLEKNDRLICRFFFNGTIPEQSKASAFLRSLIHQAVKESRNLITVVKRASEIQGPDLFNRFDALWDLFVEIIRRLSRKLYIIVDAIDECENNFQGIIIDRLTQLLRSQTSPSIKIFLTTRPNAPAFHFMQQRLSTSNEYIRLSLEDQRSIVDSDINIVIHERLHQLTQIGIIDERYQKDLQSFLVSRADRTFLWVSISLSLLENGDHMFLSITDLLVYLQKLPPQLVTTYQNYLESIPIPSRYLAGNILRVIVASARPLEIQELQVLITIKQSDRSVKDLEETNLSLLLIQKLFGPLIRAPEAKLGLLHYSLREYLIDLGTRKDDALSADFGVDMKREALKLAQSCIWYLSFEDFQTDTLYDGPHDEVRSSPSTSSFSDASSSIDQEEIPWSLFGVTNDESMLKLSPERQATCAARYVFFDYAAMNWATHFYDSNDLATPGLHDLASALCDTSTPRGDNWFGYSRIDDSRDMSFASGKKFQHPLSTASFLGLASTVHRILELCICDPTQLGNAAYWAARGGNLACLREIMAAKDIDPKTCYHEEQSPLAAAAGYGHVQNLQHLIESKKFDVNEKGKRGLVPLALAARGGHAIVVKELLSLDNEGTAVNSLDRDGQTPLFWAVSANSTQVTMQVMASDHVDMNHRDRYGRTALIWAVIDGHEDQVNLLIRDTRTDIGIQDSSGRTALMYAAKGGFGNIVRSLLRTKRANSEAQDKSGRNAISWAGGQRKHEVLHALLTNKSVRGCNCFDAVDIDGWAPLAWALDPPGYSANFSLLLQCKDVNPDRRDKSGRSLLSLAAGYGRLEITKTLVQTNGVDLNSRCPGGQTPLSYAASSGNCDIVELLLRQPGLDPMIADNAGRTPMRWAQTMNRSKVVQILSHLYIRPLL